jgi:Protein of unknown function (DUF1579)
MEQRTMTLISRAARILSFVMTCTLCFVTLCSVAHAQNASFTSPSTHYAYILMQQMVGTWNVQQRMWPGSGAEAINLPPAIARRRLVEGAFLEGVMEPAQTPAHEPFTRTAYFNYNAVNQQYEYFSLDSRAPQMMSEKSNVAAEQSKPSKGGIKLYGGSFVAPRWGEATNAAFMYRLTIGEVEKDRQVIELYLTPQSENAKEFLAFEYVYTRRH